MLSQYLQDKLNEIKKSVLVFDIETSSFYSEGKPVEIRTNFEDYVKYAKVKWVGCYSYKYNKDYLLNAQEDTQQILNLFKEHNVLVGFNSEEFDFPILSNNGFTDELKRYNQVDVMAILGTSNFKNKKGYAYKNRAELMDVKLKNNHLRGMAEAFKLDTQKGSIDYKIFFKDTWTKEEEYDIKKYLYSDIMATKELFEKLWHYWLPFAELLEDKNVLDLSWIKSSIASMTYKAACKIIGTEPTYSEKVGASEEMGGNVIMPKIEEETGVWYVDVGSLYPHMISMANLPAEVPFDEIVGRPKIWHGNEVFKVKGYYDTGKWHPLAKYISDKLKERIYLKENDPKNPMVYSLKIFLNGLYGIFRSPIFEKIHTPNCGWDTCYLGQQVQQLIIDMLEQFGFKIIAGDTDSVMFFTKDPKNNTREYVTECLTQITDIIKDNMPFPVDTFKINIEHYLEYIMFPFEDAPIVTEDGSNMKMNGRLVYERIGKKKNYVYIYDNKGTMDVKIVGLPIKKDNATELGMRIYEDILKPEIIKNMKAKFPKSFIESKVNEYLQRPEAVQLISVEYKVNSSSSYKTNCIQKQISDAYFAGSEGVIRLVKNAKVGKCGKGTLYCTIQEAVDAKLSKDDFDLEKVWQELSPFVEYKPLQTHNIEEIDGKQLPATPVKKRGRPKKTLDTSV